MSKLDNLCLIDIFSPASHARGSDWIVAPQDGFAPNPEA